MAVKGTVFLNIALQKNLQKMVYFNSLAIERINVVMCQSIVERRPISYC